MAKVSYVTNCRNIRTHLWEGVPVDRGQLVSRAFKEPTRHLDRPVHDFVIPSTTERIIKQVDKNKVMNKPEVYVKKVDQLFDRYDK